MAREIPNYMRTKCKRCGADKKPKRFCRNCLYGKAAPQPLLKRDGAA